MSQISSALQASAIEAQRDGDVPVYIPSKVPGLVRGDHIEVRSRDGRIFPACVLRNEGPDDLYDGMEQLFVRILTD